ncbi:aminotransferase [Anaerosporomusa subterranea]|uniref:Aminotransferase n=1 Tax=Anaerosporomusa subterranea TaxID=1794912 RepID=A0A154BPP4_ANASB|nr:PLP-dependent aminotransferase family protein [Anaerosporomusa subterranea]KYZ75954.1 aminotransferase [Anaerosporomusa subterranea]
MEKAYERIAAAIERSIREGRFQPREKLPSVRELSATYGVSKNTVVKAYETLKSKHLVYSVPQSGCYILGHRLRLEQPETMIIDFSRGNPLLDTIYTPDLKHCLDRAIDICNTNSSDWHELYGVPSLRKLLPKYLADYQVFTTPENIFVNLGVQQALNILNNMPFPNKKEIILIEQPTFRYYNQFLKSSGTKILGIPRGPAGIDLDFLEDLFKKEKIKFFYTVPNSHNPLGTCYPKQQRKSIAQLAEKYDVYIVEDDYFGDILFGDHGDPIYSYGDHKHHIYLKSLIKIIPWIRVGITVVPSFLLPIFTEYARYSYYNSYFSPSLVSQATLEIYIRSNLLKKHISSIKRDLSARLECLKTHFTDAAKYGAEWVGGESGFYCYLQLPDCINEAQLVENLKKRNILVTPGIECFIDSHYYKKGIRLSVARTSVADINRGMPEIYRELSALRQNMPPVVLQS